MARYIFLGGDPIDHFTLGRISPGDEREFDEPPSEGLWKPAKRATKTKPADATPAAPDRAEEG